MIASRHSFLQRDDLRASLTKATEQLRNQHRALERILALPRGNNRQGKLWANRRARARIKNEMQTLKELLRHET